MCKKFSCIDTNIFTVDYPSTWHHATCFHSTVCLLFTYTQIRTVLPIAKNNFLVLVMKGSCPALTILFSQVLMLMFIIISHTKTSRYNLNHLVSHEKLQQRNSFNMEPDNLALLEVQHLKKVVPRPDMPLPVTSSRHTDSMILPWVIWTVLSRLSYSNTFKWCTDE